MHSFISHISSFFFFSFSSFSFFLFFSKTKSKQIDNYVGPWFSSGKEAMSSSLFSCGVVVNIAYRLELERKEHHVSVLRIYICNQSKHLGLFNFYLCGELGLNLS